MTFLLDLKSSTRSLPLSSLKVPAFTVGLGDPAEIVNLEDVATEIDADREVSFQIMPRLATALSDIEREDFQVRACRLQKLRPVPENSLLRRSSRNPT